MGKGLYCQPEIALSGDNYNDFVKREIKYQKEKNVLDEDANIEMLLGTHLHRVFPCK